MATNERDWEFDSPEKMYELMVGSNFGSEISDIVHLANIEKERVSRKIVEALSLGSNDSVLEIGSGSGAVSQFISPIVSKLYCCDISESFLNKARTNLAYLSNTSFHRIENGNLDFLGGHSIQACYSVDVFIHLNLFEIFSYFQELNRVMVSGGRFYFNVAMGHDLFLEIPKKFLEMNEFYHKQKRVGSLMQWNSVHAVLGIAKHFGFHSLLHEDGYFLLIKKK